MAVKYVKDFIFGPMTSVQRYAKGGHVTKVPAKAKDSAKGMPARAKPNAPARGAARMESAPKMGKGQGYAEGGVVPGKKMDRLPTKTPPGRDYDLAPAKPFKGEYQGYAKGGKVAKVMGEYKKGELHSGSKKGPVVKNPKQAIAIALSEARKSGAKIAKKADGGEIGGPTSYADSGSAGGTKIGFKEAFRKAREAGLKEFTWKGDKYSTKTKEEVKSSREEKMDKGSGKEPQSGRVYKTRQMEQREYYAKNPEPGAETGELTEMMLGPKAKAAAGAGALAAGTYAAGKLRGALENMASRARGAMTDVSRGDLAMARPAAARAAEAEAQMARFRNAQRSPGMTGYKRGGVMKKAEGGAVDAYGNKKEPYRGPAMTPKMREAIAKAKQEEMDRKMREAYARFPKTDPGLKKGGMARKAMPAHKAKAMYGGGKC
jgi:hypothetical protein